MLIGGKSDGDLKYIVNNLTNINSSRISTLHLPFSNVNDFNYDEISAEINEFKPKIIWIGLGAPKQEKFMKLLLPKIKTGIMIGVGAAFDFYNPKSGVRRAPRFFRYLRIEWIYRLLLQPKKTIPRVIRNTFYLSFIFVKTLFIRKTIS